MDALDLNFNSDINKNKFYDCTANTMNTSQSTIMYGSNIINKPFFNNLYYNMKNNTYEVTIMWCLLIVTIILLLSLLIKDAHDEIETERVI